MTSPSFSDRDQALRQMMGPPTAQEHLREAMRRDTDMRWSLLPVEESPKPDRNLKWMLSALGIGVVVCGVMWWAAGAGPFRF